MICYRILPTDRLVIITGRDALVASEALDIQDAIRADPDFNPAFSLLTDYLNVTHLDFSADDLRRMAGNSPFGPSARRAYVAREALIFGLLRMYETFAGIAKDSDLLRVFRDIDSARHWLLGDPTPAGA